MTPAYVRAFAAPCRVAAACSARAGADVVREHARRGKSAAVDDYVRKFAFAR